MRNILRKKKLWSTSGKLWLKMRRMSIVSLVLYFFGSSLRWTRRMDLILRALDTPDVVDYFSYPQHGQQVRENFLEAFEVKNFTQSSGNSEISRCSCELEKWLFDSKLFFWKCLKKFKWTYYIDFFTQTCLHTCIRLMQNLKSVREKFQKIFGKVRPPQIAIWGGVCKYIACLTRVYLTWIDHSKFGFEVTSWHFNICFLPFSDALVAKKLFLCVLLPSNKIKKVPWLSEL